VGDRDEPEALCWEWHGHGTAGEDDRAEHLAAVAPVWRWVRLVQDDTSLGGKRPPGARQGRPHAECLRGLRQNVARRLAEGNRPNTPTRTAAPNQCLRTSTKIIQR
jgi:hypothetical protein